jgi:hypothetical protein
VGGGLNRLILPFLLVINWYLSHDEDRRHLVDRGEKDSFLFRSMNLNFEDSAYLSCPCLH